MPKRIGTLVIADDPEAKLRVTFVVNGLTLDCTPSSLQRLYLLPAVVSPDSRSCLAQG